MGRTCAGLAQRVSNLGVLSTVSKSHKFDTELVAIGCYTDAEERYGRGTMDVCEQRPSWPEGLEQSTCVRLVTNLTPPDADGDLEYIVKPWRSRSYELPSDSFLEDTKGEPQPGRERMTLTGCTLHLHEGGYSLHLSCWELLQGFLGHPLAYRPSSGRMTPRTFWRCGTIQWRGDWTRHSCFSTLGLPTTRQIRKNCAQPFLPIEADHDLQRRLRKAVRSSVHGSSDGTCGEIDKLSRAEVWDHTLVRLWQRFD